MKNHARSITQWLTIIILSQPYFLFSQKVGVGTDTPEGRFHVMGMTDQSAFVIDAEGPLSNMFPLIRLRSSTGADLLRIHADTIFNLFVGLNAGRVNVPGSGFRNTFIGSNAGFNNTSGNYNTAIGSASFVANTTGHSNTATGAFALTANTTGDFNTATGRDALESNTTGDFNTATGHQALATNNSGYENTAMGHLSLSSNTIGYRNTAIGNGTLSNNVGGFNNTALGRTAMLSNISGNENTALGAYALYANTSGSRNTASGYFALADNTTGVENTAFGYEALQSIALGTENVAVGIQALSSISTGNFNVAVGSYAGYDHTSGSYNTYIGRSARSNAAGHQRSCALGAQTVVTASNQVRIGDSATSIGGPQNWTNTSDRRIKTNVKHDVPGLTFINLLQPVTYNKSYSLESEVIGRKDDLELPPDNNYETIRYSGFIAQDVEAAAQSIGYDFSGVDPAKNTMDLYGLRYAEFTVPLVKAVQELSAENLFLKSQLKSLTQVIDDLATRIIALEAANKRVAAD